jgi:hypothetical protein
MRINLYELQQTKEWSDFMNAGQEYRESTKTNMKDKFTKENFYQKRNALNRADTALRRKEKEYLF